MKTKKHDTSWMVSVALMAAIVIVLANTPLGMIQLPIIKATTVHIPVILGAILLGPAAGAILGGVFGICSLISNTMAPTLLSFAFSPFMSTTGIPGAIKAVWISVGCRILIGVAAGWLWILFSKLKVNSIIALPIVGFAGAMVNTITVMGSIYILFAKQYAEAKAKGLNLDMSRGKPSATQLNVSLGLLDAINASSDLKAENGTDCRNYGVLDGIPEAKKLMADMMGTTPEHIIVYGNASLNIMYDQVSRAYTHGILGNTLGQA